MALLGQHRSSPTSLWRGWLALLALAGLVGCGAAPARDGVLDTTVSFSTETIAEAPRLATYRIGINTEVTGTGAQIGDLSIRAARLAIEEINAAGGVNGIPLELVVRDCRSDVATAAAEYRHAVAADELVALLGPLKSAYAIAMVPEHRGSALPMFIGATNDTLTSPDHPNLFRMRPSDRITAAAMVALAVEELDARRVGIIHDSDAFGSGGARRVAAELEQRGMQPAASVSYPTGAKGFDELVHAMAAASVDTVLIYGTNPTDVGVLLRAIRYWKLDVTIVTSPGGASAVTRNVAAEAQDGIYVAVDAIFSDSTAGAAFEAAFLQRFGMPPDTYVAWYYDAIYLIAETLRRAEAGPARLGVAIRGAVYHGAQGRYQFDAAGEGLHHVTLVRMGGGEAAIVATYEARGLVVAPTWRSHAERARP